ncbi:MAG: CPBP family intramembrane metalloprotease [Bacteriovoracaceae bacterium]|nr:CPBP family intramembrane metalloprotease [Bacteriovoracaceae bacterium]
MYVKLALFALYFIAVWFIPWPGISFLPSISSVYFFDIVFILGLTFLFKLKLKKGKVEKTVLIKYSILTLIFAFVSILIAKVFNFNNPFIYLENPVLQLIILAPILEELVYRFVLINSLEGDSLDGRVILLSALIFSLSHVSGLIHLPKVFSSFIILQIVYTFFLGFVCAHARMKSKGVILPIWLHFLFNLVFLIFMT